MLKLIKYELRKQMVSKAIMAVILATLVIMFLIAIFKESEPFAYLALVLMFFAMVFSTLYSALECGDVYDKDLKTKQSYMLFMIPHSSVTILGAKMLAAIVQAIYVLLIHGLAIGGCISLYMIKNEGMQAFVDKIVSWVEAFFDIEINFISMLEVFVAILILWIFTVILYMFVLTVFNTLVKKRNLVILLSVGMYCLLFYLVIRGEYWMCELAMPELLVDVLSYVYMIAFDIALFFGTAWLIDKKLSV